MIALLTAALGVVAGLLLGGCTPGDDEVTGKLLQRNAALETQVSASQDITTALAITLVIVAAGLGATLLKKGARCGKERKSGKR